MLRYSSIFLLCIQFIVFISCGKKIKEDKKIIRPVKAIKISDISDFQNRSFPGVSKESKESELAFRISGPLKQLPVTEGQQLKKGQLVAEIDPRDFKVNLLARQGRFEQAKAEKERFSRLYERGSIPKNDLDIKTANYLEAKAAYASARNALKDTRLIAPFNAYVDKKYVENFEEVRKGQAIVSLLDLSALEIDTTLPEYIAIQVANFESYSVEFDLYPGKQFKASLKEIGKKSIGAGQGFPLYLYLDHINNDSGVKIPPGASCKVRIKLREDADTETNLIIPITAVFEKENEKKPSVWVYLPDQKKVTKRHVEVGLLRGDNSIQILGGLKTGEWVVTAGTHRLTEGQEVKLLEKKS